MIKYEQEQVGDYILTYMGHKFYVTDPKPEQIDIRDIIHATANITRFTGHTRHKFYTVGEHMGYASYMAEMLGYSKRVQLIALLHDASEAYCNDINRPLKQTLPQYKEAEDRIMNAIWDKFLDYPPTEEEYHIVKKIDNTLLLMEMEQLMYRTDDLPNVEHFENYKDFGGFDMKIQLGIPQIKEFLKLVFEELTDTKVEDDSLEQVN
jgi:hypothetical protein